jgi:hypothetical protein
MRAICIAVIVFLVLAVAGIGHVSMCLGDTEVSVTIPAYDGKPDDLDAAIGSGTTAYDDIGDTTFEYSEPVFGEPWWEHIPDIRVPAWQRAPHRVANDADIEDLSTLSMYGWWGHAPMQLPIYEVEDDPMPLPGGPTWSDPLCPDGWSKEGRFQIIDNRSDDAFTADLVDVEVCASNGLIRIPSNTNGGTTEGVLDITIALEELSQIRKKIDVLISEMKEYRKELLSR